MLIDSNVLLDVLEEDPVWYEWTFLSAPMRQSKS